MADTTHQPAELIKRIADPVPIGVAGFALTTFTLGLYTTGKFFAAGEILVFVFAVFYGGLVQFVAGLFALRRGDIFPATFMTTYGAFWFSFVGLNTYVVPKLPKADVGQTVTIFLIMWTVPTVLFLGASFFTNWVVVFAFAEFVLTVILLTIATYNANVGLTHFCGYLEMLLAAVAWYIVLADMVNGAAERPVLPLPRTPWNPLTRVAQAL